MVNQSKKETGAKLLQQEEKKIQREKRREGALVYIGPAKRGIPAGTVLSNGLSEPAEELIRKIPLGRLLFVPLSELGQRRRELSAGHTARSIAYRKVKEAEI